MAFFLDKSPKLWYNCTRERKVSMWVPHKIKRNLEEAQKELTNIATQKQTIEKQITSLRQTLSNLQEQKQQVEQELNSIAFGRDVYGSLEEVSYDFIPPTEELNEIELVLCEKEQRLGQLLKNGEAYICDREYVIDHSRTKGQKFQQSFGKNLIIGFNTYAQSKIKSITADNYNNTIELIEKAYTKYNRQGAYVCIRIAPAYLLLTKEIARLKLDLKILKAEEKEKLRQEKARLKEQEKLLEDLAKEKEKLAKERRYYEAIYGDTESETKRAEIKERLADIDTREQNLDKRAKDYKAGWLYIAYTKAMPKYCKLGCTKRYNPLIRLQELSSASVPYPFECCGLVFSEDVFTLEANIHSYFNDKRVNKGNRHKEFFYITPQEAIKALREKFNCDIIFLEEEEKTIDN